MSKSQNIEITDLPGFESLPEDRPSLEVAPSPKLKDKVLPDFSPTITEAEIKEAADIADTRRKGLESAQVTLKELQQEAQTIESTLGAAIEAGDRAKVRKLMEARRDHHFDLLGAESAAAKAEMALLDAAEAQSTFVRIEATQRAGELTAKVEELTRQRNYHGNIAIAEQNRGMAFGAQRSKSLNRLSELQQRIKNSLQNEAV